jgi:hypothetical protein
MCVPRAYGGGPVTSPELTVTPSCSPRIRGWTGRGQYGPGGPRVFPVHTGVDRTGQDPRCRSLRVPRAYGGGPASDSASLRRAHVPVNTWRRS